MDRDYGKSAREKADRLMDYMERAERRAIRRKRWRGVMEDGGWLLAFIALVMAAGFILFWWIPGKVADNAAQAFEEHCLERPRKPSPYCEGGFGDE